MRNKKLLTDEKLVQNHKIYVWAFPISLLVQSQMHVHSLGIEVDSMRIDKQIFTQNYASTCKIKSQTQRIASSKDLG